MSITPSALGSASAILNSIPTRPAAASGDFAGMLGSAMDQVNSMQASAEQKVTSLLTGSGQDIHEATLSVEQASLAFDLMLQVRNKVVSAYQEISRLQF